MKSTNISASIAMMLIILLSLTTACQKENLSINNTDTPLVKETIADATPQISAQQLKDLQSVKSQFSAEVQEAIDQIVVGNSQQSNKSAICSENTQTSITTTFPCKVNQKPNIHFWSWNPQTKVDVLVVAYDGNGFLYQAQHNNTYSHVEIVDAPLSNTPYNCFLLTRVSSSCVWRVASSASILIERC